MLPIFLSAAFTQATAQRRQTEDAFERPVNPSKFHVDIYSHPKTTFSCDGRNAGEYYADPEAKCAIYFICLGNANGSLSALSFACPNGTLFQQATRVCSPEEQVFCSLATRFYDSVNGHIDSKGKEAKDLSHNGAVHTHSWLSNQKKRQEQRRAPSSPIPNLQPVPLQSQAVPRVKQLKPNPGPRIPPPKVLAPSSATSSRKVAKVAVLLPTATKKPEARDYEEPGEEELEYENTAPVRNQ